jgi:hypothetical protein
MTTVTMPNALVAGQPENVNALNANLNAIVTVVNGGIDNTNLAGGITDAKLASPNNTVWRTLAETPVQISQSTAAGTYWIQGLVANMGQPTLSGATGQPYPVNLDPAEYVVAGKTAKLRLRVTLLVGGAPAIAPVFGIYTISSLGGTSSVTVTLGATVPGSTATFAGLVTPGAGVTAVSGTFDFPTSGQYLFGVNVPGTTAANSYVSGRMQLQLSHV